MLNEPILSQEDKKRRMGGNVNIPERRLRGSQASEEGNFDQIVELFHAG